MGSECFCGRIKDGDRVLWDNLEIWLKEDARSGTVRSWIGAFRLPAPVSMPKGQPYYIELDDGRAGNVVVSGASIDGHSGTIVRFETDGQFG